MKIDFQIAYLHICLNVYHSIVKIDGRSNARHHDLVSYETGQLVHQQHLPRMGHFM
jgi:hypothetical protein